MLYILVDYRGLNPPFLILILYLWASWIDMWQSIYFNNEFRIHILLHAAVTVNMTVKDPKDPPLVCLQMQTMHGGVEHDLMWVVSH